MSLPTVKRYETAASAKVSDREIDKLRAALEASGIEFIDGTGREAQESEGQAEMTPAQCRADRAALKREVRDLADAANVSTSTIIRLERGEDLLARTVNAARAALEAFAFAADGEVKLAEKGKGKRK